jgi:hypothetical protein
LYESSSSTLPPAITNADLPCAARPLLSKAGGSSQLATCWKPFVYKPIQTLHMAAILENFIMNLSLSVYSEPWIIPFTYPTQNPPYSFLLIHPPSQNHIASYHLCHFNKTNTTIGKVHRSNF